MREVTNSQFFDFIGPLDVHPNHENPNYTTWETRNKRVIGQTLPGWRNGYVNGIKTEPQYFLKD